MKESAPEQTLAYAPPPLPEHEEFVGTDAASPLLAKDADKRAQDDAHAEMRKMRGFHNVYTCPRCKTRIKPREVNGQPDYGKCPKCLSGVFPETKKVYVGQPYERTNRYGNEDPAAFQAGIHKSVGRVVVHRQRNIGAVGKSKDV